MVMCFSWSYLVMPSGGTMSCIFVSGGMMVCVIVGDVPFAIVVAADAVDRASAFLTVWRHSSAYVP